MNMTFRQLRLVLALADTGSISAAARATHVTQPTASMQLREAANAVGLPLYEVIGKRVHLTEAGKELARTARAMSAEWEAFEQKIDGLRGLTRGRLKVAVVSTAKYFVPRLLGSFCATYPRLIFHSRYSIAMAWSADCPTISTTCTSCRCRLLTSISTIRC